MKTVIQRVTKASVRVENQIIAEISTGLLILAGFGKTDSQDCLAGMAQKISNLRIFPDAQGRLHFSVKEINGAVLIVPQFTLFADTSKGRRPEFFEALNPQEAKIYFERFTKLFSELGISKVEQGEFGAEMKVLLENDGPLTILLEN